jgi:hypothetical protein
MLMQARNVLKYFARIGALRDGMVVLAMVRRLLFISTSLMIPTKQRSKNPSLRGTNLAEFGFGSRLPSPPAVLGPAFGVARG